MAMLTVMPLCASMSAGCVASEGPLLVREGAPDAGGARSPVQLGASLQYQLTGTIDTTVNAELFVTDLFDTRASDVSALHARGRVVIAYVSTGSLEPWRPDAASFPAAAVGTHLTGYPSESWLDTRSPAVRAAMEARFDLARSKGFDGIFASTLGAYAASSGFPLSRSDELQYDRFLADAARVRGLSPGLSGDFELGLEVAAAFDWALAVSCIARSDCGKLASFQAMDKPVFDLETAGTQTSVCAQARALGIPTTLKHDRYDSWRDPCS
jgi:hypothetical protein